MSRLENVNPEVFERRKEREILPEEQDDSIRDEIDAREVFGEAPVCYIVRVIDTLLTRVVHAQLQPYLFL